MITKKNAIDIYKRNHPENELIKVVESNEEYIFGIKNDDREGYDTVSKFDGSEKFMWIWDYIYKCKSGEAEPFSKKARSAFVYRSVSRLDNFLKKARRFTVCLSNCSRDFPYVKSYSILFSVLFTRYI